MAKWISARGIAACLLAGLAVLPTQALGADPVPNECVTALRLQSGWCGDGGPAVRALLYSPSSVSAWSDGSFVVMDSGATEERGVRLAVVRRVTADGTIAVAAGTGRDGSTGDGGAATAARVSAGQLAALPDGGFLLSETRHHRVRRVWPDGTISTVAGTGEAGFGGDGGPATAAALQSPRGLAFTPDGGFLVADSGNARIRRVAPDGTIDTVAGSGAWGGEGDWGPATAARLRKPTDVAALPDGGFVVVDRPLDVGDTLVKVVLASQTIFTLANLSHVPEVGCSCGIGDPAIAVAAKASLLLTTFNSVLDVSRDQSARIVAGDTMCGYGGDGGPALRARFSGIADIAALPSGGFLLADADNSRIRRVDAAGAVTTIAGGGGRSGRADGATSSRLCATPPKYPPWNGFELLPAHGSPRPVRVRIATGLPAVVTLTVTKGGRRVRGPLRYSVRGERDVVIARSLPRGSYRVVAIGRAQGKTAKRTVTVRVRS